MHLHFVTPKYSFGLYFFFQPTFLSITLMTREGLRDLLAPSPTFRTWQSRALTWIKKVHELLQHHPWRYTPSTDLRCKTWQSRAPLLSRHGTWSTRPAKGSAHSRQLGILPLQLQSPGQSGGKQKKIVILHKSSLLGFIALKYSTKMYFFFFFGGEWGFETEKLLSL